ncbi:MAG: hypothetical protein ACSLFD_02810 [Solirubrobacterales bacterium]
MQKLRRTFRAVTGLAIACVAILGFSAAVSPAATFKNVYWIDMYYSAEKHPDFVYFTANAGGQVRHVKWKNWGGQKTLGRGRFVDTSAHYPGKPNQNGPAKLIASKPTKCTPTDGNKKGKTIRIYRKVILRHPDGKGGRHVDNISGMGGDGACAETR